MNLDLTPNPPTGGVKAGQIGMREPTRVSMAPGQHRPEQGRGSSRAQERAPDRAPGRNPRPLERGPALPLGRAQPARRHRHPLEYRSSRRGGQTTETRRADRRARAPGPHLTPGVGPHPAHRRIPVAKTPITALAYDPAPYRSRPEKEREDSVVIKYPISIPAGSTKRIDFDIPQKWESDLDSITCLTVQTTKEVLHVKRAYAKPSLPCKKCKAKHRENGPVSYR